MGQFSSYCFLPKGKKSQWNWAETKLDAYTWYIVLTYQTTFFPKHTNHMISFLFYPFFNFLFDKKLEYYFSGNLWKWNALISRLESIWRIHMNVVSFYPISWLTWLISDNFFKKWRLLSFSILFTRRRCHFEIELRQVKQEIS